VRWNSGGDGAAKLGFAAVIAGLFLLSFLLISISSFFLFCPGEQVQGRSI
jgi:hypothetical protein